MTRPARYGIVYVITNTINGKQYVGQTIQQLAAEVEWTRRLNTMAPSGYNLKAGKGRGMVSESTRQRMSNALRGRKASDETRRKLSIAHAGIRLSDEAKSKLSAANKGKKPRASEANAKTYHLIDSSGRAVTVNMRRFCAENGLSTSKMSNVVTGKRRHHHGWRLDTVAI